MQVDEAQRRDDHIRCQRALRQVVEQPRQHLYIACVSIRQHTPARIAAGSRTAASAPVYVVACALGSSLSLSLSHSLSRSLALTLSLSQSDSESERESEVTKA